MTPSQYHRGDRVRHAVRPEWGEGVVEQAAVAPGDSGAQRLVVSFANHGRVTINTAFASIVPANGSANDNTGQGWLDRVAATGNGGATPKQLSDLPDGCTDPFASLTKRLKATLDLYRFERTPLALMEWAVAQTGLTDPLSEHSRHDLEQNFLTFERQRESQLIALVKDAKRQGRAEAITQLSGKLKPYAQAALQRVWRSA